MTELKANWTSDGVPYSVTTIVGANDDFDTKFAEHKLAIREGQILHPPDP